MQLHAPIDPAVDAHGSAPSAGDRLQEGPALPDYLRHPGVEEYRHTTWRRTIPGLGPATSGVETVIPAERRIDGVAEVTFRSARSPLRGPEQTRLAHKMK